MKAKIFEIVKEVGRNALLGAVSYLLTAGVLDNLLLMVFKTHLNVQTVLIVSASVGYVLRGIEKQLHDQDSRMQLPF